MMPKAQIPPASPAQRTLPPGAPPQVIHCEAMDCIANTSGNQSALVFLFQSNGELIEPMAVFNVEHAYQTVKRAYDRIKASERGLERKNCSLCGITIFGEVAETGDTCLGCRKEEEPPPRDPFIHTTA